MKAETMLALKRRKAGLTLERLADTTGLNRATVARAEAGRDVLHSTALVLARALGTSADTLLELDVCQNCGGTRSEMGVKNTSGLFLRWEMRCPSCDSPWD